MLRHATHTGRHSTRQPKQRARELASVSSREGLRDYLGDKEEAFGGSPETEMSFTRRMHHSAFVLDEQRRGGSLMLIGAGL